MRQFDLSGCWKIILQDENTVQYEARLPGTLDENEIGHADENREQWHPDVALTEAETDASAGSKITTRLTRRYSYTGIAAFTRSFVWENDPQNRVFLEIERSRKLSATMNGVPVHPRCPGTLSTPWVFEVTSHLHSGRNACTLFCDNAYTGWPYREIVYSSAATDETQTNWNGILGYLRLRVERKTFLSAIRVIPYDEKKLRIFVELDSLEGFSGTLKISSPAFREDLVREVSVSGGTHGMELFYTGGLQETCRFWDEGEGILYPLTVSGDGLESKTVLFGLRQFSGETGRLTLNGRPIFLRCETNCCVFPETGHMPMEKKVWRSIL